MHAAIWLFYCGTPPALACMLLDRPAAGAQATLAVWPEYRLWVRSETVNLLDSHPRQKLSCFSSRISAPNPDLFNSSF